MSSIQTFPTIPVNGNARRSRPDPLPTREPVTFTGNDKTGWVQTGGPPLQSGPGRVTVIKDGTPEPPKQPKVRPAWAKVADTLLTDLIGKPVEVWFQGDALGNPLCGTLEKVETFEILLTNSAHAGASSVVFKGAIARITESRSAS